jgi:hypothetical protein
MTENEQKQGQMSDKELEVLLQVYGGQRSEARGKKTTIFNLFSLTAAGLLTIIAGLVAAAATTTGIGLAPKVIVGVGVLLIWLLVLRFTQQQRAGVDEAMQIMRKIEKHLGLFESGRYIPGTSVYPPEYCAPPLRGRLGLAPGDQKGMKLLLFIAVAIWLLIFFAKPCP